MFSHKFNNKNYHINKLYFNWKTVMLLNLCTQIRLSSLFIMWFEMKCSVCVDRICEGMRERARARQYRVHKNEQNRQWLLCFIYSI